jgi:hypothetical protein
LSVTVCNRAVNNLIKISTFERIYGFECVQKKKKKKKMKERILSLFYYFGEDSPNYYEKKKCIKAEAQSSILKLNFISYVMVNSFMLFYHRYYKKILDEEFPNLKSQEKTKMAGELWRNMPDDLKKSFVKFSEDEKTLKTLTKIEDQFYFNRDDNFIYDHHCYKIKRDKNDDLDKLFEEIINENAYEP